MAYKAMGCLLLLLFIKTCHFKFNIWLLWFLLLSVLLLEYVPFQNIPYTIIHVEYANQTLHIKLHVHKLIYSGIALEY